MTEPQRSTARTPSQEQPTKDAELDELETETVQDLDADDDAEDVRGGTTWHCLK
jgi:hypothetical protein